MPAGWRGCDPVRLLLLAESVAEAGEDGAAARAQVIDHLITAYLKNASGRPSVSCAQWSQFVAALAKDLSPEVKKRWADALWLAFVADANALRELELDELRLLTEAIKPLDEKMAGKVVAAWMVVRGQRVPAQPPS